MMRTAIGSLGSQVLAPWTQVSQPAQELVSDGWTHCAVEDAAEPDCEGSWTASVMSDRNGALLGLAHPSSWRQGRCLPDEVPCPEARGGSLGMSAIY